MSVDIPKLISQMTLEEKASICSGQDAWFTQDVPRLNIPKVMLSDGPHGVRKQEVQTFTSTKAVEAICFPTACATSSTFNPDLLVEMGNALGEECLALDVQVLLGPAMNIKRSPLCGRNFEYFSEDPLVASKLSGALVKGMQEKNVGACLKHFAANNQEDHRMATSSDIDERAYHEIYLAAFEGAVRESQPMTIMCSYNRINGIYASENEELLTKVLRDEWGYEGLVMTDWGAANDRVLGLKAGLDLEMPGPCKYNNALIVKAVKEGALDEKILNKTVERVLNIVFKTHNARCKIPLDKEAHHQVARKVGEETIVLLKNEENLLPLNKEKKIAFIGEFAANPRYQGSGSSRITTYKVDNAVDAVKSVCNVTYATGYILDKDEIVPNLEAEAVKVAQAADVAVIFAGLPNLFESEGYDRTHMRMPNCQNHLIEEIAKVQKNIVVVLHNGSPCEMPWINHAKSVVEAYLAGEAVGSVIVDILFGKVNPSGRLPETFPLRLEDNPSYLDFPGCGMKVSYLEGVFVGYRYYDMKKMDVLFPFGHGLSYTTFEYSNLKLSKPDVSDQETLTVTVDVKNTGSVAGKEVVQLYVSDKTKAANRPPKELKGFVKLSLNPGETKTATFTLDKRAFQWYNTELKQWYAVSGKYEIIIGKSSRNLVLTKEVNFISSFKKPFNVHLNTLFYELIENPITKPVADKLIFETFPHIKEVFASNTDEAIMVQSMVREAPLRSLTVFCGFDRDYSVKLMDACNAALQAAK